MIDPNTETLLSLHDAAHLLPRRRQGKPVHVSCIYRWTTSGCRGVVLESLQIGARRCTSCEALARFYAALSNPNPSIRVARTPAKRQANIDLAERRLAAHGYELAPLACTEKAPSFDQRKFNENATSTILWHAKCSASRPRRNVA